MAVGLDLGDGEIFKGKFDEKFPLAHRSKWKPTTSDFIDEIKRRKEILGKKPKVNSQMKLSVALDWLVENPILGDDDKAFVLHKVAAFLKVSSEVAAEKPKPSGSQKWVGIVPYLRLIHCITDKDDAKASFLKSFSVKTRKELEDRKLTKDVWAIVSDYFNDPNFNVTSSLYPMLHDDFSSAIHLGYQAVSGMGKLDATKAKSKFMKLKNDLVYVKNNYEKSGNGEGCHTNIDDSFEDEVIDGSAKKNFLRGRSPAILYLWEKADEFDLLDSVTQQLDDATGIDISSNDGSELTMKRKFQNEEETVMKLKRSIERANEIAEKTLKIKEHKLHNEKINTCSEKISGLETLLMSTEEKLCLIDDKTSPLASLYNRRIKALTDQIEEQKQKLKELI